jgi:hypothetical protein
VSLFESLAIFPGAIAHNKAANPARLLLANQSEGFNQIDLTFSLTHRSRQEDHDVIPGQPELAARARARPFHRRRRKNFLINTIVDSHEVVSRIQGRTVLARGMGDEDYLIGVSKAAQGPRADFGSKIVEVGLPWLALSGIPDRRESDALRSVDGVECLSCVAVDKVYIPPSDQFGELLDGLLICPEV